MSDLLYQVELHPQFTAREWRVIREQTEALWRRLVLDRHEDEERRRVRAST